jgi:hypothetical protein
MSLAEYDIGYGPARLAPAGEGVGDGTGVVMGAGVVSG